MSTVYTCTKLLDKQTLDLFLHDQNLDLSKVNTFVDDNLKVAQTWNLGLIGRKHSRKRRKCWYPAFSPFPLMCPKGHCNKTTNPPYILILTH